MFSQDAKEHLHDHLRWARDALVWKLDGLSDYDVRRPMTATGTNLLGLVKHVAIWDSRYLGEVFDRPFPKDLPRWDDTSVRGTDHWASINESRSDIIGSTNGYAHTLTPPLRHLPSTTSAMCLGGTSRSRSST